jgi:hypothetical protein
MSLGAKRFTGAIAGAVVAGLGITAMLVAGERKSGQPSELVDLERAGAKQLGLEVPAADALPDAREQTIVQTGHLALSVIAGAAFAAAVDEEASVVPAGIGFGLAFYAVAHWITGPLLGLKRPEWQSGRKTITMHTLNHIGFGLVTALGARAASRI